MKRVVNTRAQGRAGALLRAVNEAAILLTKATPDAFAQAVLASLEKIAAALSMDRAYVWRAEEADGAPVYRQLYGWETKGEGAPGSLLTVLGTDSIPRVPQWEDRFRAHAYIAETAEEFTGLVRAQFTACGIRAILAFPMFTQDVCRGFISFDNRHDTTLCSAREASILQSAALLFASALERNAGRLEMEARMEQQRLMSGIAERFLSKEATGDMIRTVLADIGAFLGVSRVLIAVFEAHADVSRPEYCWFADPAYAPGASRRGFAGILRGLFPGARPEHEETPCLCCENALTHEGGRFRVFHERSGLRSFVCAPVYVDGRLWGVVSVEEHARFRAWSQSDLQLIRMAVSTVSCAVARDIIEKTRAAALRQALLSNRAKSNFLSNMSHEMRTPMNAVIGMTAVGLASPEPEKKNAAFLKIDGASKHLLAVINDILDMSKLEANALDLAPAPFRFAALIHDAADRARFRAEERRQRLTVTIADNIPQTLVGDGQRLGQVVSNLLSNAVKFTPEEGRIRLEASLVSEKDGLCRVAIRVSDTGIGIAEEQLPRLFNSFEQADVGAARKYGGMGLGLALCKRILALMDGEITVASTLGHGATFTVTPLLRLPDEEQDEDGQASARGLPGKRARAEEGRAAEGARPPQSEEAPDDFSGHTALLAEDIAINREVMQALLEPTGLTLAYAEDGRRALRMFEANPGRYGLIFMDVQMPEMDGYEVTRRIRALRFAWAQSIPIVAVTANVFSEDIRRCLDAGMNAHIGKPLNPPEVMATLRKYLPPSGAKPTAK